MSIIPQENKVVKTSQRVSPLTETTRQSSKAVRSILQSIDDYIEEHIEYGTYLEKYILTPQCDSRAKILYDISQEITRLSKVNINNDFLQAALKQTMLDRGIEVLRHCEGPTLMDFVREGMEIIQKSTTIKQGLKHFYMIVWFFLHYGKTDIQILERNKANHENPLDKQGSYEFKFESYDQLHEISSPGFRELIQLLQKNGLHGNFLKRALWLIENHRSFFLIQEDALLEHSLPLYLQDPKYFVVLCDLVNIYVQSEAQYSIDHGLQRAHGSSQTLLKNMIKNLEVYKNLSACLSASKQVGKQQKLLIDALFHGLRNNDALSIDTINHTHIRLNELSKQ